MVKTGGLNYGKDLGKILTKYVTAIPEGAIREAVSNETDETADEVDVTIGDKEIVVEGNGRGFKEIYSALSLVGDHTKREQAEQEGLTGMDIPAGMYHWGRLSYFKLGRVVTYYSNNGVYGQWARMYDPETTPLEECLEYDNDPKNEPNKYLNHRGGKIVISELKIKNTKAFKKDAWTYLRKCFGLMIYEKGLKLRVNREIMRVTGNEFGKQKGYDEIEFQATDNRTGITKTHKAYINSDAGGAGSFKIYAAGPLYVTTESIAPRLDCNGRIICPTLTPAVGRSELIKDDGVYEALVPAALHHLRDVKKYQTREMLADKNFDRAKRFIQFMSGAYLAQFDEEKNTIGGGSLKQIQEGNQKTAKKEEEGKETRRTLPDDDPNKQHGTVEPKNTGRRRRGKDKGDKKGQEKKQRPKQSGINVYKTEEGEDQDSMYFLPINQVFVNMTDPLTKDVYLAPYKTEIWGSMYTRMAADLADVVIQMRKDHYNWSEDKRKIERKRAHHFIMKTIEEKWKKVDDEDSDVENNQKEVQNN